MIFNFRVIGHTDTYALRHIVLWPEKNIDEIKVKGDESALHVGVFEGDRHIGVVSLFVDGKDIQFRKLAVLQEFQMAGAGVGSALMAASIAMASKVGALKLWGDARQEAVGFYAKLGFEIDPAVFTKSGILYQKAFACPPYPELSLKGPFRDANEEIAKFAEEARFWFPVAPEGSARLDHAEAGSAVAGDPGSTPLMHHVTTATLHEGAGKCGLFM